jgi:argininosuccinate lyase
LNDFEATGPIVWRGLDTVVASLDLMRGLMASLRVKRDAMAALAGENFLQATQLAETITRDESVGFRVAHKIVGQLVKRCIQDGIAPTEVRSEMLNQASLAVTGRPLRMRAETLRACMDVGFILKHRKTLGGPGRQEVLRMLRRRVALSGRDRAWLQAQRERVAQAQRVTDALARRIMR